MVLIQTGKMKSFPVVLLGKEYWAGMIDFVRKTLVAESTISPPDLDRVLVTDDPQEAAASISGVAMTQFGLSYGPRAKRRWWLFE
jgi:predicted Rossmann-fold nucleotide-binding protein